MRDQRAKRHRPTPVWVSTFVWHRVSPNRRITPTRAQLSLELRLLRSLAKLYRLCGPGHNISLLQAFHQSLIFRDQFWVTLSSAALDFKQPTHQLARVFHDVLHHRWQPRPKLSPCHPRLRSRHVRLLVQTVSSQTAETHTNWCSSKSLLARSISTFFLAASSLLTR
jgi:hypothetical protein